MIEGNDDLELFSKSGLPLTKGYTRVVIGGRGPYIEFNESHIIKDSFTIPQELKYRKTILVLPYTSNIDEAKRILGKTSIKSVLGFSAGGYKTWPSSGEYEFVGLIDPTTKKDSLRYHINDKRVHMIYNPKNWGFPEVVKCQKKAANLMLGNALLLDIDHSKMPLEFFKRFVNYL